MMVNMMMVTTLIVTAIVKNIITMIIKQKKQELMDELSRTAKGYDIKVNIKKTKVMKMSRKGEGKINITNDDDEESLEQVDQFRYLGVLITNYDRCETEIKTRIGIAKNAFNQKRSY